MNNIALIGMMGSGKTTIGKILSQKLNKDYYSSDKYIEKIENRTISEIFEVSGEKYFREVEIKIIKELSTKDNIVLATGGGIVLNKENIQNLIKNNFLIIFLNRDINEIIKDIDTTNRPLLKESINKLYTIYEKRELLYRNYCNIMIRNNSSIEIAVDKIINEIKNF